MSQPHKEAAKQVPSQLRQPYKKKRSRRLRCDCGKMAVTVIEVRVGSDPQYTVHLALCADCLELERELHQKYSS